LTFFGANFHNAVSAGKKASAPCDWQNHN